MEFRIEFDREEDGRWIADIPELPGVLAYGATQEEAKAGVEALALRVLADRIIEESKQTIPAVTFA
jgi:predicted RNase H-like HicB family nuclease